MSPCKQSYRIGYFYMLIFMTNEFSQPFLHANWYMAKCKVNPKHPLSIINGILLLVSFISLRFVSNIIIQLSMFHHASWIFDPRDMRGLSVIEGSIHVLLNTYWCYLLLKQVAQLVTGGSGKKKEGATTTASAVDTKKDQ